MGLWIKLQPIRGEFNLEPFQERLGQMFGVLDIQPRILNGGRAVKLMGEDKEAQDGHPILEYSNHDFVVYLNWSDNRFGHVYHLIQLILDEHEVEGHCYDGYHHKDRQAVVRFLTDFAGLRAPVDDRN